MTAPALAGRAAALPLADRLAAESRSLAGRATTVWVLALVGPIVAGLAACTVLFGDGRWLTLPRALPLMGLALSQCLGLPLAFWVHRRADRLTRLADLAGVIEREQALRDGSLRGALEVAATGPLGARAAQDVAARLVPSALAPALARRWAVRQRWAIALSIVTLLLLGAAVRRFSDGWRATVHPVQAWRGTLLPALAFDRLPASVPRGMPLTVRIHATGRRTIAVSRRAEGEPWRDTTLTVAAADGDASLALGPVRSPVTLRVNDGRSAELMATVGVNERGWIGDIALFAEYPAYLGRTNEALEAVSPVRVPRGTRLRISARLRGGVATAALSDGQQTVVLAPMTEDAARAGGEGIPARGVVTLDHDGQWGWQATAGAARGAETLAPELPDSLSVVVLADKTPEVLIAAPNSEATITTTGSVGVLVRAADDHGLGAIALSVWREPAAASAAARAAMPRQRMAVAAPDAPFFEGGLMLPLDGRGLEPGDRLHVVAFATDDSPWHQQATSREVILRVPSLTEQREMARSMADSLAQQAQQMAQQEKRLQQSTADAARSRDLKADARGGDQNGASKANGNKAMSFQQAERARQMAKDQQEMSARIDSLRQNAKALEDRLKGANALDTAMANRMKDIQKMLRDALTPEMQKQLETLNKSADRLSGTEAQQSMEQLAEQQRQLRQQLEKSAEMLKRAALEGAMSTLRDEAKDVAEAQRRLAEQLQRKPDEAKGPTEDPKTLAERTKALKAEIDRLAKRLEEAGAKPGASQTRAAQPMVDQATKAMEQAARDAAAERQAAAEKMAEQKTSADKTGKGDPSKGDPSKADPSKGSDPSKSDPSKTNAAQSQGGQGAPQPGQQGQQGQSGGSGGGSGSQQASQASEAMRKAAQQLANAKEAQVNAWKGELSDQLDQSINETQQLARQQSELAQKMKQGASGQSMQGEQGALQQGVQQAAERLEQAGRTSSLLSQRSQKAMADAQRRVQQATQQMGQAGQPGSEEAAQNAMKDATEALNQALSSLVRDRERVNGAQSASGFQEMMQQMKELAQKQGQLNGQMQGLTGAQGDAARQQARTLARQQRDVARALSDVSDADQSGRTDALAKEAQALAQQIERAGVDPTVAARQQQLYRRLLDAGRFMEQEERDEQGKREATASTGTGSTTKTTGPTSGKAASKFAPPTWNDLRGLGAEDRRLVIEYFRRLNGTPPR